MNRPQAPKPVVRPNLTPSVGLPANGNRVLNVDVNSDVSLTKDDVKSHLHLVIRDSSTSPTPTLDVTEWVIDDDKITAKAGGVTIDITATTWPTKMFKINLTTAYSVTLNEIKWDD